MPHETAQQSVLLKTIDSGSPVASPDIVGGIYYPSDPARFFTGPSKQGPIDWSERESSFSCAGHLVRFSDREDQEWSSFFVGYSKCLVSDVPVEICTNREADGYLVRCRALGIVEFAETAHEARQELDGEVVYLYFHYKSLRPHEVTAEAKRIKNFFENHFAEQSY